MSTAAIYAALPQRLLPWYAQNARALPWRENRDPYRVWLSEIMLQQTRVEAVRGYYARFLAQLPDIAALAAADEQQLLKLWEGLGYYNRARNLQKAARQIMQCHGGIFPESYAEIRALAGIGDYTAGAIASICFEQPTPAVDGNVLRVLARLTADDSCTDEPAVKAHFRNALAAVYPPGHCGDFTQSLMELGATVCVPNGAPHCDSCPMADLCRARQQGRQTDFPVRRKKAARKLEEKTVFLLTCGDSIALQRRQDTGLLAGLWQLPNIPGTLTAAEAVAQAEAWGIAPRQLLQSRQRKHIFTHIEWHMTCYDIRCAVPGGDFLWVPRQQLQGEYALPTAFRLFLE